MKIGWFPQHMSSNIEHNCKSIANLGIAFAALSEQDFGRITTFPKIRSAVGNKYRILSEDKGQHSQETPILFKRLRSATIRITDVTVTQITPDLKNQTGIGNDRWQLEVRAEQRKRWRRKKWLIIATHWNAAIQNKETGAPLERSMRFIVTDEKAGKVLERAIRAGKEEGRTIHVMGDFNYRMKGLSGTWYYAPENIFKRTGLRFVTLGLDYIAWSKDVHPKDGIHIIAPTPRDPNGVNRADHPWFWGDFRRVK